MRQRSTKGLIYEISWGAAAQFNVTCGWDMERLDMSRFWPNYRHPGLWNIYHICRCVSQRPAPNPTVLTPIHYILNIAVFYIKKHKIIINGYSSGIHLPLTLSTSSPLCIPACLYLPPWLYISLLG